MNWQAALTYALLGRALDDLSSRPTSRDLDAYLVDLERRAPQELAAVRISTRSTGRLNAHAVPAEIRGQLGYAQLTALLREVEARLVATSSRGPVVKDRPLDAAERRLVADAPPHHQG